jgi:hypothetical protein
VGKSREILRSLIQDLAEYIGDTSITYDLYRIIPQDLESQSSVKGDRRIALYEEADRVIERTGPYKASLSEVRYAIDISVARGYMREDASSGELPLADLRDWVLDWVRNVDAGAVTDCDLYYFGYDGATDITRLDIYVTQTLRFVAQRDLISTQKNN